MAGVARRRLAMIGIDAGDLRLIESSLARLPNLRRALETGALFKLRTTAGMLTGSVWPTFYTRSLPGEHGIYHHLQWDAKAMRMRRVSADWLYCKPFWYDLARQGLSVTVLDVPMTFPSRLEHGIEVINWGSHDQLGPFHSNRLDIACEIRRHCGRHPMSSEIPVTKTHAQLERIRKNLVDGARRKGALTRWLMERTDWDFFLAVFGECHRGGHILWPDENDGSSLVPEDALSDVYRAVDEAIGVVVDAIDMRSTTVLLFSLHGMGPNMSQEHFVPRIMDRVNTGFQANRETEASPPPRQRSFIRLLRNTLPARFQNGVAQSVPVAVRDWVVSRAAAGGHNWQRTPGFALLADQNGYLRYNLAGRETKGSLQMDSDGQRRYIKWLTDNLLELRISATGAPLVKDVVSVADVFPGTRSTYLPDLIVTWEDSAPATQIQSERIGTVTAKLDTGRSGNHRAEGFCVVLNGGAERGKAASFSLEHIVDLAPMAFQYLSCPGPE